MTLTKRNGNFFGELQADIREYLNLYTTDGYTADHFADAKCACGGSVFRLAVDEDEGAAVRTCPACHAAHPIGDSAEYLDDAELEECACPCGSETLQITVGVSLYSDSEDVRWLYLACRCPTCGLIGVYADWKNEFEDYRKLLDRV